MKILNGVIFIISNKCKQNYSLLWAQFHYIASKIDESCLQANTINCLAYVGRVWIAFDKRETIKKKNVTWYVRRIGLHMFIHCRQFNLCWCLWYDSHTGWRNSTCFFLAFTCKLCEKYDSLIHRPILNFILVFAARIENRSALLLYYL